MNWLEQKSDSVKNRLSGKDIKLVFYYHSKSDRETFCRKKQQIEANVYFLTRRNSYAFKEDKHKNKAF